MTNWHLARDYRYAGVHCGIRPDPDRLDLALVVSETPASAAGVFTQNQVVAAPVHVCRERLPRAGVEPLQERHAAHAECLLHSREQRVERLLTAQQAAGKCR